MNQWWKRRENIELGEYTKDKVEDFTGRIPLFLDKCVVEGKINLKNEFFSEIRHEAQSFEENIQSKCKANHSQLSRYTTAVLPT